MTTLGSLPQREGVTEEFWWLWKENYVDHVDVDIHPITDDIVYGINKKDSAPDGKAEFNYYVVLQEASTGKQTLLHKYHSAIGPYGRSSVSIRPSGSVAVFLSASFQSDPILVGAGVSVIGGVFKPYIMDQWNEARVASLEQQNAALRQRMEALEAGEGRLSAQEKEALTRLVRFLGL